MRALVLADLDDTLFQTRRKVAHVPQEDLAVLSRLADGRPSGYATPVQRALLALLEGATLVPVTARSRGALGRTTVMARPAVCANGGCILDAAGEPDREWHALLGERAARAGAGVAETFALVDAACAGLDVRRWVVAEEDLSLYVVVKDNAGEGRALEALVDGPLAHALPEGWRVHLNGNNLALSPPWLGKRDAVAHLLPRLVGQRSDVPVIGLGDSLSDAGFMDLCHYALAPTGSQLWRALVSDSSWVPPAPAAVATAGASGG